LRQFLVSMTVGEKAEVAHFVQALGQDMEDESAQEFRGVQGLGSQLAGSLVVLEAERHLAVLQSHHLLFIMYHDEYGEALPVISGSIQI
jgi:hypothetical protein